MSDPVRLLEQMRAGAVKPEFGNVEHIKAVKVDQQIPGEGGLLWDVTVDARVTAKIQIWAPSYQAACAAARAQFDSSDADDCSITSIDAIQHGAVA